MTELAYYHHGGNIVTQLAHYLAFREAWRLVSTSRFAPLLPILLALVLVVGLGRMLAGRRPVRRARRLGGSRAWYRTSYLRSAWWACRRRGALRRAGDRCEVCGTGGRLDVHHLTYDRLGRERPGDLQVLCRACHDVAERAKGNR